ncbi:putative hydro-lyase [Homoserinibacter sp. YIM 151385]|uniref:putative hydro-lyase n=1 Tax=Homoserinibacter sp. YIM 151385 TaxID=2985506 RepID=UPI0022EFF3EC|nr:putative hydro-lyase [Homoserinibacter sp. YIM 151385]WBU37881.1 putative hydro-lyase [Homoserinibacter sp. YIM 151385]
MTAAASLPTAASTPAEARAAYRSGLLAPTTGVASGHAQANLIALPAEDAADFRRFAELNPKPCPILDETSPGAVTSRLTAGGDLRTDIPRYRVWRHGELVEERADAVEAWAEHDDLVAFLIGCSFTFEFPLLDAGIPIRHMAAGRNVPMYVTGIDCEPAGRFSGRLVVSMRGIPEDQVEAAIEVSGRYPAVHGAPVHVGDPAAIGIRDLHAPEHGDAPVLEPGDVPVFWACGVTPQAAVMASRPAFAITHAPGYMLVTDARDEDYRVA